MSVKKFTVPDIGGDEVEVTEVMVASRRRC